MEQFQLKFPREVYGGQRALTRISDILVRNEAKRVAIFTDKGVESAGLLDYPVAQVQACGVGYCVLDDLVPEPTYDQVQTVVDAFKQSGADFIIAIGGGSVMDAAKLASVLATEDYGVKDLLDNPKLAKKYVKTLMIPTTAGTGAEATPNAIVAVPEKQLKVGIVSDEMMADYVILDGTMIKNLPRKIAAATGVDALSHAIECWTSNKANIFSDTFALAAMDLIFNNILKACNDPDALDEKNRMLLASFYAGVAITSSGTTAVHALSYPLGGKYHISHGVSNAMLLVPVMLFNEPACRDRLAVAYDRCVNSKECGSIEEKSKYMIALLQKIVEDLEIPTSLKEFGVTEEDLDDLVSAGMQVKRLLVNNPRVVTPQDAESIYRKLFQ